MSSDEHTPWIEIKKEEFEMKNIKKLLLLCLVLCALSTPHIIGKSGTIEINGRIDVDDVELY